MTFEAETVGKTEMIGLLANFFGQLQAFVKYGEGLLVVALRGQDNSVGEAALNQDDCQIVFFGNLDAFVQMPGAL